VVVEQIQEIVPEVVEETVVEPTPEYLIIEED
jgi:hypothetical protein